MSAPVTYLPRTVDRTLADALASAPVVLLDGPRAAGKTTTANRWSASSVRLPRDLDALRVDPAGYLRSLESPVLIDEWQLAGTDLLWIIKDIVDADPGPGRFLLTGSVEPATYGPTYPLTGRAIRLVVRPMTWAELHGRGAEPTFLEQAINGGGEALGSPDPDPFDLSALATSGFPGSRGLPDAQLFLDAYASLIAQRAGDEGRDSTRLLRAMRAVATLSGQAAPDQRIWEAADINKASWTNYQDLLTRVHVLTPSPAFESNRLRRLTAYPKWFLADTALALALADLTTAELATSPALTGRFLEAFVMQQLRTQADQVRGHVLHVRTGAGEREIDAVVETPAGVIGIEVKLGTRPNAHDARQLEWLRANLGKRFIAGFVVHTGDIRYAVSDRIWALPVGLLSG